MLRKRFHKTITIITHFFSFQFVQINKLFVRINPFFHGHK